MPSVVKIEEERSISQSYEKDFENIMEKIKIKNKNGDSGSSFPPPPLIKNNLNSQNLHLKDDSKDKEKPPTENGKMVAEIILGKQIETTNGLKKDPSLQWKLTGESYLNGPDQILPSTAVRTSHVDGAVQLHECHVSSVNIPPISIPSLMKKAAERAPNHMALAIKRDGDWKKWSYQQYYQDVRTAAKGFIALGLERLHAVCIIGLNTPEWLISDLAAIFCGGLAAGIYTTSSASSCAFCAMDSKAQIFVVEDAFQLAKILEIRAQLPNLKAIIQYTGKPTEEGVLSWTDLMLLGKAQGDAILEERLRQISINQCCTLIYTSGTTGTAKGVMLNHDNLIWTAYSMQYLCEGKICGEEYISFLPLSHVAGQINDIYIPLNINVSVYFGDSNALKGSLIDTMREVRPTKFFAVPRVWEKFYEKMQEIGANTKGLKRTIATWAKSQGLDCNMKKMEGISNPESLGFKIANKLILSKVRGALGFSRCSLHLSGAAPMSKEILKYFMSLNIVVTEAYGMSEASGPHNMGVESSFRLGSCGQPMPGCLTKIGEGGEGDNGEILMKGRNVFMGYVNQWEKTTLALDESGWLHSEDLGRVDEDGFLFVTGRLKEIIITAGGENVAPAPIEDKIKYELPFISQAVVLGDRLKFLSVLLTLKADVNKDTQESLEGLLPNTKNWIEVKGNCQVDTVKDVLDELYIKKNDELRRAIQDGIERVNSKAVSHAQRIQKWKILPIDFSLPGGELGPTLKLKRQVVYDKYKETIEDFYKI